MSANTGKGSAVRVLTILVLVGLVSMILPSSSPASGKPPGPSTFDLYAPFLSNTVPSSDALSAFEFKVRSINGGLYTVDISAASDSAFLVPELTRGKVLMTRLRPEVTMLLRVRSSGAPSGSSGWVTVTARKGLEVHRLYFQVTVRDALPVLELGSEEGAKEQDLQLADGSPVEVSLRASNRGAAATAFPLSASAPEGWGVSFKSGSGETIESLSLDGMKQYVEFATPTDFVAVIDPPADFPESPATEVALRVGEASISVGLARRGMLWSPNDTAGIYPHVHQVMAGGTTTYKLYVTNPDQSRTAYVLSTKGVPAGWSAKLGRRAITVAPGATATVDLSLSTPAAAPAGQAATVTVEARGGGVTETVSLAARVNNTPKVYYFSIDSMSYSYLTYNATGTAPGHDGDWLMPNIHGFMADSVSFTDASALMPAATDMNHTSALSGCYPGTEGIYCVSMTFNGTSPHGRMVTEPTSLDHGWTVKNGQDVKVQRIFELAKQANPEALCAFLSNKSWLVDLECDPETQTAVERSVSSESQPVYMQPVEKFVLGDPPSDNDPILDPLQKSMLAIGASHLVTEKLPQWVWPDRSTLPKPILNMFGADMFSGVDELLRWIVLPANVGVGGNPQGFCNDSHIGDSLMALIEQEDPDVTYCNLGELDETGHLVGSAEDPAEWDSKGTGRARDDISKYNNFALRDDAIDVAREADLVFGRFVDGLKKRGVYDSSVIVMLADHGMHNYKRPEKGYVVLNNRELLRKNGLVMGTDYDYDAGLMDYDVIYSRDKKNLGSVEKVLEEYTVEDREEGTVHPMIVYNREEMKSGTDTFSGISVNPGELYSQYWVERDSAWEESMKWPDLFVFITDSYYSRIYADTATKGANAIGIKVDVNLPPELSLMATGGHISFDTRHVPLIYKAPGVKAGETVGQKVFLTDIAPTIYDALGWETPAFVDGKPLPLP